MAGEQAEGGGAPGRRRFLQEEVGVHSSSAHWLAGVNAELRPPPKAGKAAVGDLQGPNTSVGTSLSWMFDW